MNNPDASFNYFDGEVEERHIISAGQLLFAWSGTPGTSFGAHIWAGQKAVLNQHIFKVHIDETSLNKRFFRFALNERLTTFIEKAHGGVGLRHITKGKFEETELTVPPLDVQRRIVKKLDELLAQSRAAREQLEAVPALVETYRQSVLAAAFRGDLTADWRKKNPNVEAASKLLERIRIERRTKWEEAEIGKMTAKGVKPKDDKWKTKYVEPGPTDGAGLGALPGAWCTEKLEAVCDPNRGIPYGIVQTGDAVETGVPTVRCGDIKNFKIDFGGLKRVRPALDEAYPRTRLEGGEVLLAIRGSVGEVATASAELVGANISREVAMIPPLRSISARLLMYFLRSPVAQAALLRETKGVAQQGINLADVRELLVPLIPAAEQRELVSRIDEALLRLGDLAKQVDDVEEAIPSLERSLLAKAFSGQLES